MKFRKENLELLKLNVKYLEAINETEEEDITVSSREHVYY